MAENEAVSPMPEAPAEAQETGLEGNEPVEKTEEQEAAPESTENGTEIEGGSEEESSPSEAKSAQKSEEKPPEPPKTIKIGDKEVSAEKAVKAIEAYETSKKHLDIADKTLNYIKESPKAAFLTIFTGTMGSKEKAQAEWNRICEEQVIENWKLANEPEEERVKRELTALKAEREKEEKDALQRRQTAETEKARQVILPQIKDALKKAGQDPDDPGIIGLVATIMAKTADEGGYLPAEEAVPLALERLDGLLSKRLKSYPKDMLLGLRPELKQDILTESIQSVRQAKATPKTAQQPEAKPRRTGPKVVSQGDFRRLFG